MPGASPGGMTITTRLRTSRRAATRIALHAGAVPHQRETPALRAHLAFVVFGIGTVFGFGVAFLA